MAKSKFRYFLMTTAFCLLATVHASAPDPVLYQEYPEPNEDQQFAKAAIEIRTIQERLAKGAPIARAFHAKTHGCLKGVFTVLPQIPDEAKYGIFVPGAQYPVTGRFSNASGASQSDKTRDLRGMALKLTTGPDQVQDFLMTNGPVEFVKNVPQMLEFANAASHGLTGMLGFLVTHPKAAVTIAKQTGRKVMSLTGETYWSRVPFKIGPEAMKFRARPCTPVTGSFIKTDTYLTDDLRARAAQGTTCFNFEIQFQRNAVRQPIEDPTVEWSESETPFITIAKIEFPAQTFDSTEELQECTSLSYSPWHTVDFKPMGNLNRGRQVVYESSATYRNAKGIK